MYGRRTGVWGMTNGWAMDDGHLSHDNSSQLSRCKNAKDSNLNLKSENIEIRDKQSALKFGVSQQFQFLKKCIFERTTDGQRMPL